MTKTRLVLAILAAGAISVLGEDSASQVDAWKKPVPEWTVDDAHQIMTDSPWVKTTTPTMEGRASTASVDAQGEAGAGAAASELAALGLDCPEESDGPAGTPAEVVIPAATLPTRAPAIPMTAEERSRLRRRS